MEKASVYICIPRTGNLSADLEQAAAYCRIVYEAGYLPVCPALSLPHYINDKIPSEHKDGLAIVRRNLRSCKALVLCNPVPNAAMKYEVALARQLEIPATTLDGLLTARNLGRDKA